MPQTSSTTDEAPEAEAKPSPDEAPATAVPMQATDVPGLADVHRPGHPPGGGTDDGPVHMPVPAEKKGRR